MQLSNLILILLLLTAFSYVIGRQRAYKVSSGAIKQLHSLPSYYGSLTALWCIVPALLVLGVWTAMENTLITLTSKHSCLNIFPKQGTGAIFVVAQTLMHYLNNGKTCIKPYKIC